MALMLLATMWTLYFIVAIIFLFSQTSSTGAFAVAIIVYLGVLFDLIWNKWWAGKINFADVLFNILSLVFSIPFGLYFLGLAPKSWLYVGAIGLVLSFVLTAYLNGRISEKESTDV